MKPSSSTRGHEIASAIESQLSQHEAELGVRRHLLKDEIANEVRDPRDSAEYSADQSAFGVNAAILEATARTMRNIEDAMQRLKSASYGRCLDCEGRIPLARLEALPFAERCRECQESIDEAVRQKAEVRYGPFA